MIPLSCGIGMASNGPSTVLGPQVDTGATAQGEEAVRAVGKDLDRYRFDLHRPGEVAPPLSGCHPATRELGQIKTAQRGESPSQLRGPAMRGPATRGPAMRGPAMRGPAMRGPAMRGPVTRGRAKAPAASDSRAHPSDSNSTVNPTTGSRLTTAWRRPPGMKTKSPASCTNSQSRTMGRCLNFPHSDLNQSCAWDPLPKSRSDFLINALVTQRFTPS
jgi:hypothetical protein